MPKRPPIHRPLGRSREQQTAAAKKAIDERRGSSAQRGYGADWQRVRAAHLSSEPLCRMCNDEGSVTPATVVDHIVSIADAPHLRLVDSNLRSLCKRHHDQRTARDQGLGKKRVGAGRISGAFGA